MRERLVSGRRAFSQLSRRWPASADATWKTTLWRGSGGLLRFRHDWVRGWAGIRLRRHRAPIVELQPAPAAVKQAALAGEAFQEVQEPAMLAVDLVGLFEAYYPVRATQRAAAGRAKMVAEAARGELLALARTAFINSHVTETFEERSVNPPQSSATRPAFHPCLLERNLGKRKSPRDNNVSVWPLIKFYAGPHYRAWRAPAQSQEHRRRNPQALAHGHHRTERIG